MEEFSIDAIIPSLDDLPSKPEVEEQEEEQEEIVTPVEEQEEEPIIQEDTIESDSDANADLAALYYQELVDQGIAPESEKENITWDDVHSTIESYKTELPNQIVNNIVNQSPDLGKDLIDYVLTKGSELSKEDLKEFYSTYLNDITAPDNINDEDSARGFLVKTYEDKGFTKTQAESAVDALEDDNVDIVEKAKELAKNRKSKELLDQTKESVQQKQQQQQAFINQLGEELNQLDWRPSRIRKLKNELVSGNTNQTLQTIISDPKGLVQLANILTYYDAKTNTFDLSDFTQQAQSQKKKSLKDRINRDMFSSAGSGNGKQKEKITRGGLKPII